MPRQRQFESILNDALLVPMEQRLEFVRSAAGEDVALLSELEIAVENANESAMATFDTTKARVVPESLPVFSTGEKIGIYIVEKPLGQGGFGTVYKCHDETADRHVAIKVFSHECDSNELAGSRFEAKANAKVRHPQIAKFLHTGSLETRNVEYLVYEFIEGPTLKAHLEQLKVMRPNLAVGLILDLCGPLSAIHESGLTHRDLKPANILLDASLTPHLLDFGLAVSEADQAQMPEHVAGTTAYMAPEQLAGKIESIDGRTDIWALGVILYQSLTGVLPFNDKFAIGEGRFRPPSMRIPNVPLGLDAICKKCLTVDVSSRYDSMASLAAELKKVYQPTDGHDVGDTTVLTDNDKTHRSSSGTGLKTTSSSRRSIRLAAIAFAAIGALVLGLMYSRSPSSPSDENDENPRAATNDSISSRETSVPNGKTGLGGSAKISDASERNASIWALSRGANISVNDWEEIRPGMPLPEGNFSLVAVDFESCDFADHDLETLSHFKVPNLESIDLSSTRVTDQGMRYLLKFRQLNDLTIRESEVGDEGMKFVARIPNLLNLYIDESRVTDQGIESLSKVKFQNLHLENLKGVTDLSAKLLSAIDSLERDGLNIKGTSITDLAIEKYGLDK